MHIPKVFLLVGCLGLVSSQACAEDDFTASLRLRGGFDSNPLFSLGQAGGSAFVAADTALAAGMKADGYTLGVAAEANAMHYAQPQVTPARGGKVILRGSIGDDRPLPTSAPTLCARPNWSNRSGPKPGAGQSSYSMNALTTVARTRILFMTFLPC
jgi:hypothetical protein